MNLEIESFMGVGPLKFGMDASQVAALPEMGPPRKSFPVFDGSLNEFRTMDLPVCNYVNGELSTVDTTWRTVGVRFKDIDFYNEEPAEVCRKLQRYNGYALLGLGSILFPEIGINIGGFLNIETMKFVDGGAVDQDERGVAAFRKGAFDSLLGEYERIDLLEGR